MKMVEQIEFHGHILNVYDSIDDPLFLAVEVACMIDYSVGHTSHMLDTVADNEKVLINISSRRNSASGAHNVRKWFLTEFGLYEVLMQSRKPIAQRFKSVIKEELRNMRRSRNESPRLWFSHIDRMADYEDYCAAVDEYDQDPISFKEFVERRIQEENKLYEEE